MDDIIIPKPVGELAIIRGRGGGRLEVQILNDWSHVILAHTSRSPIVHTLATFL